MPRLGKCCDAMEAAMKFGFIEVNPLDKEELIFSRRNLKKQLPDAKAGNVLTGETHDPATFEMAFGISYCPFCGDPLTLDAKYAGDPALEEDG